MSTTKQTKTVDTQKLAIGKRLQELYKALGLKSVAGLGKALNYDRHDTIYNVINGENFPGADLLINLSNIFENVNLSWLLTGKGEMLKKDKSGTHGMPDHLLTQIEDYANGILLSLQGLRQKPLDVPGKGIGVAPMPVQEAKTLDRTKTEKKLKGR